MLLHQYVVQLTVLRLEAQYTGPWPASGKGQRRGHRRDASMHDGRPSLFERKYLRQSPASSRTRPPSGCGPTWTIRSRRDRLHHVAPSRQVAPCCTMATGQLVAHFRSWPRKIVRRIRTAGSVWSTDQTSESVSDCEGGQ